MCDKANIPRHGCAAINAITSTSHSALPHPTCTRSNETASCKRLPDRSLRRDCLLQATARSQPSQPALWERHARRVSQGTSLKAATASRRDDSRSYAVTRLHAAATVARGRFRTASPHRHRIAACPSNSPPRTTILRAEAVSAALPRPHRGCTPAEAGAAVAAAPAPAPGATAAASAPPLRRELRTPPSPALRLATGAVVDSCEGQL